MLTPYSCVLYTAPPAQGGTLLVDWTRQAVGLSPEHTIHGFGACGFFVPLPPKRQQTWYVRLRAAHLVVRDRGTVVFEGRCEDIAMSPPDATRPERGLTITAYGYWRAFNTLNIAMWSDNTFARWRPMTDTETGGSARKPDIYEVSTDNGRMRLSFKKGEAYDVGRVLTMIYRIPAGSARLLTTIDVTYSNLILRDFQRLNITACDDGLTNLVSLLTVTGPAVTAGPVTATYDFSATPRQMVIIQLYDTRSAITVNGAAGPSAGVINLPVSSTTGLYRGQFIWIGTDATSEDINITQIPASGSPAGTVTVSSLAAAHVNGDPISYVYKERGDTAGVTFTALTLKTTNSASVNPVEVVSYLISQAASLNPTQISTNTSQIGISTVTPASRTQDGIVLLQYAYDYTEMGGLIESLTALGDTSGNTWRASVGPDQILTYGAQPASPLVFQIRLTPPIATVLDQLYTRAIPQYQDANGDTAIGTTQVSSIAENVNKLVRQRVFSAPTTDQTTAQTLAAASLTDTTVAGNWGEITTDRVYQNGALVPFHKIKSGALIQCVTLPQAANALTTGSGPIDRTRSFRLASRRINRGQGGAPDTITLTPETQASQVDAMLARQEAAQLSV